MQRNEKRKQDRSGARPGGVVVVQDFGFSLERALREFKRVCAPELSEARHNRYFAPKPTRSGRKRRGKELERRKECMCDAPLVVDGRCMKCNHKAPRAK